MEIYDLQSWVFPYISAELADVLTEHMGKEFDVREHRREETFYFESGRWLICITPDNLGIQLKDRISPLPSLILQVMLDLCREERQRIQTIVYRFALDKQYEAERKEMLILGQQKSLPEDMWKTITRTYYP